MRPYVLVAPMAIATLAAAPTAPGASGGSGASSGGASAASRGADVPSRSGGVEFGAPVPKPGAPVARRLAPTPREIVAGDAAPAIRLRVRQRGVERVRTRLVVLRLPTNRPVARRQLGWLRTNRSVTVRLPKALKLRTGRYLVRLHVTDPLGHALRRSRTYPGRTRFVVRRPKAALVAPRAPALPAPVPTPGLLTPALPAPAPSPAGRGVFPVLGAFHFGGVDARFGAGRPGHIHQGQDIGAAAGTPVVAPYAGTISHTDFQASGAGEYVVLDGADGRDYFFAHCLRRSTLVAEGSAVIAGQPLCSVGATGTTSGAPHLHFEIWQVGWRVDGGAPIDPLPELRVWAGL